VSLIFLQRIFTLIIPFWFSLIYSIGILIVYFKKRNFLKKAISIGIAFFIFLFLTIGIFQSISTYYAWKADPIMKYSIPPINPDYFYGYCFFHYFFSFFISLGAAIFLGLIFFIFKKKNYVDFNEVLLVILGTIIVGSPNFIIFLGLNFLIAIFFGLWQNYISPVEEFRKDFSKEKSNSRSYSKFLYGVKGVKIKARISLTLPMIISLLITILTGNIISNLTGLSVLRI